MPLKQLFKMISLFIGSQSSKKKIKGREQQFWKNVIHENVPEIGFKAAYQKKKLT